MQLGDDGIIVSIEKHSEPSYSNKMASHKNVYRIKKKRKINNNNNNSDDKIPKNREVVRRPQFDPRPRATMTSTSSSTEKIEYSTLATSAGSTKYFVPTPMPLLHESNNMDDFQVEETTFKSFKNFIPTENKNLDKIREMKDNFYNDDDQEMEEALVKESSAFNHNKNPPKNESSVYANVKKLIKSMTVKTRENDTFVPTPVPLLRTDKITTGSSSLNEFEKQSGENKRVKIIEPAPLVSVASYSPLTEKPLEVPFEISKIQKQSISGSGRPEPRTLFSNKKNIGDYNTEHDTVSQI